MTIDLLVVSIACFTSINRNIYKLFLKTGYSIVLLVPKELHFTNGKKNADPRSPDDPEIIFEDLLGNNSRTSRFRNLHEVLEKLNPRIILLDNDPVSIIALEIGRWCRRNGSSFFCFSYENMSLDISDNIRRRGIMSLPSLIFKRVLILKTRKLVDCVFTVNNEGTYIYQKELYKNVTKIPLGFDPNIFKINSKKRNEIRKVYSIIDCTVIAYFGRVSFEKGVHILISALSYLMKYRWVLFMDEFSNYKSEYGHKIINLIKSKGMINRVKFLNPSHLEIADYMNAADIVVVPSIPTPKWIEQYGRVVPESMACGKTVIAAETGALPMLLGNYGILFPAGDTLALKEILERVLYSGDTFKANHTPEEISAYAHEFHSLVRQKELMESSFSRIIQRA